MLNESFDISINCIPSGQGDSYVIVLEMKTL